MERVKKWLKGNVLTIFLLSAILGVCIYALLSAYAFRQQAIPSIQNDSDLFLSYIIENQKMQFENNGKFLNNVLCKTVLGDTVRFSSLISESNLLVLYGGSSYCNSCIDYHIQVINGMKQNLLNEIDIVLLFKGVDVRELQIIREANNLLFPLYSTDLDLGIPAEEVEQPVLFVVRPDLLVTNTFFPLKTKAVYNDTFYKQLVD